MHIRYQDTAVNFIVGAFGSAEVIVVGERGNHERVLCFRKNI